jgi:hypothetical protein
MPTGSRSVAARIRVKGQGHEFLVEGENEQEHESAEDQDQPQALDGNAEHIPKEEVTQVHGVTAHRGDQCDPQGEHPGEDNPDGGIFLDLRVFADRADAQGRDDRGPQRPPEERFTRSAADEISEGNAGQNGMRQRVAKESHAAQNHVRANHCADDADQDRGDHAALHEFILERIKKPGHEVYDFGFTICDCGGS